MATRPRSTTTPSCSATCTPHLHINLVPRLRSGGHGRRLINTLTDALRRRGSPGVHLAVPRTNERAIGFYRHVGFTQLRETGVVVFVMDLSG